MNILTFDIEDWFHILDNPETKGTSEWSKFESRLEQNLDIIFSILRDTNQKATFFIVGWMADKHPNQIKRIIDLGFEIGSHSHFHQLVYNQTPYEFDEELKRSIGVLENLSGKKVKSFRAPGFSITQSVSWAFELLIKNGIEIDSSIFPAQRSHGGFKDFGSAKPVILEQDGMFLKEFPINIQRVFGQDVIFSGGGYFRLLPYFYIKKFTKNSDYVMSYLHPRDFDPKQPMVPGLNVIRKFKSYYGLKNTDAKLRNWLRDFSFMDIAQADKEINWQGQQILDVRNF